MRSRPLLAAAVAIGAVVTGLTSCSLLASSDEEAMRGLRASVDGGNDKRDGQTPGDAAVADGSTQRQGVECGGQTCFACNSGVCAGCWVNGAKCAEDGDCCGAQCTNGICRESATTCTAADAACSGSDECCADLACVVTGIDSGTPTRACQACKQLGAVCAQGSDCCSRVCTNYQCAACIAEGAKCASDGQCCSGDCDHPKDFCKAL